MATGVKKDHQSRKNRASREEYLRLNHEENIARGPQTVVEVAEADGGEIMTVTRRRE